MMNSTSILSALVSTQINGAAIGLCSGRRRQKRGSSSRIEGEEDDIEDEDEEEGAAGTSAIMHLVQTRGLDHTAHHLKVLHR